MLSTDDITLYQLEHYKNLLGEFSAQNKTDGVLYCLRKLHDFPIEVQHIVKCATGTNINVLIQHPGNVGTCAKALIKKWCAIFSESKQSLSNYPDCSENADLPDERFPDAAHCVASSSSNTSISDSSGNLRLPIWETISDAEEKENESDTNQSSKPMIFTLCKEGLGNYESKIRKYETDSDDDDDDDRSGVKPRTNRSAS